MLDEWLDWKQRLEGQQASGLTSESVGHAHNKRLNQISLGARHDAIEHRGCLAAIIATPDSTRSVAPFTSRVSAEVGIAAKEIGTNQGADRSHFFLPVCRRLIFREHPRGPCVVRRRLNHTARFLGDRQADCRRSALGWP